MKKERERESEREGEKKESFRGALSDFLTQFVLTKNSKHRHVNLFLPKREDKK